MKMSVQITEANEVIGNGVGAVLQVREVLRVLQQHPQRPRDLEEKALFLAAKIIEIVGMAKGPEALEMAKQQLISGKAREKMKQIILAQNGNPDITSENLQLGKYTYEIIAEKEGTVKAVNLHDINAICRKLGCPSIDQAGIYLYKKVGDRIRRGEVICRLYAQDETKLRLGKERREEKSPILIKYTRK